MIRRRLFLLAVLAVSLAISPLAWASDVDPSWPAGFWDNGDFDDVILLLISAVSAVEDAPLDAVGAVPVVVGSAPEPLPSFVARAVVTRTSARAPPLA